jgi:hypothetical protein
MSSIEICHIVVGRRIMKSTGCGSFSVQILGRGPLIDGGPGGGFQTIRASRYLGIRWQHKPLFINHALHGIVLYSL